jgi:hypothetical protein
MPRLKTTSERINGWGVKKRDNAPEATRAKIQIRNSVLEAIGATDAHVFDAFAGTGVMYREVWHQAASCVGCELEGFYPEDPRECYVADNCRVMRCIDLSPFNVFDFDAYGSPWEQVYLMAVRRRVAPGERIGMVLTEGQGMKLNMGGMSNALSVIGGVRQHLPGMGAAQQHIVDRAIIRCSEMMNTTIERHWQAISKHSSTVRYIGLVMKGNELSVETDRT